MFPKLYYESKLLKKYAPVAGIDEAGRGAWAGPIVAGAVLIEPDWPKIPKKIRTIIRDSKLLSFEQREKAYEFITANFIWSAGIIDNAEIDRIGIQAANQLAMRQAVSGLQKIPQYLLVDGRGFRFEIDYKNIINGDFKVFCIAAASIIAKVTRDRILISESDKFSSYHFNENKGYGTFSHFKAIMEFGLCDLHRRSFQPMKSMVE